MSLFKVFDVSGSAMQAQTIRLNTVASNLANANAVASRPEDVYQSKKPVFETYTPNSELESDSQNYLSIHQGVRVTDVVEQDGDAVVRYEPSHPLADAKGNVYYAAVNPIEEMVDMMSASRSFQTNTEVLSTTKRMMVSLLEMGK